MACRPLLGRFFLGDFTTCFRLYIDYGVSFHVAVLAMRFTVFNPTGFNPVCLCN